MYIHPTYFTFLPTFLHLPSRYHQNQKYASNEDGKGVGELAGVYSSDTNPLFAKRAEAANSNARVMELMQKMRKQRGLPDPT
jgi:hypothetical protein